MKVNVINEQFLKPVKKLTKSDSRDYNGCWQLPSGKPGMDAVFSNEYGAVSICGDSEFGLTVEIDDDGTIYQKSFDWDKKYEDEAVKLFNSIVTDLNKGTSVEDVAKKYRLKEY